MNTSLLKDRIVGKAIVFPDYGAEKRFGKDFPKNDKIICSKFRKGDKRIVTIKEGNPEGRDVIIIDDLIQTGGTIGETADLLRLSGAKSVTSFSIHGIFPNETHIELAKKVDKLYVTDTIPVNFKRASNIHNMKALKIMELVKKIIFRY